ncbi:PIG-L family deacetylase [Nakamurella flavida]|uniref:PIG-L family deacetylase n=1 Tax=Nakamurella flavida TaxID=363630 RepID=A0A938YI64_9ACTN|nr:PIG-L deacetylase family protein [Nakamurella flavida]MBM9478146.1 PIG-L family deacetylase [Nakamurella flavida]MDP9778632.1 LmbE family N-acetylglucosaminyl deacetylase [Nakamurella flavida]
MQAEPVSTSPMPDDWQRALVLMAHPDDPEYGVAAAVAVWTAAGRDVRYVLATRGEAGIAGLAPAESGPEREREQRRAIDHVGVRELEFLDHPDGRIEYGVALRRDLAAAIRRHRPELVVTMHFGDTWFPGAWNSADHRALGRAVVDAVGDAANEWIFPELTQQGLEPWAGVRWTAVNHPGGDRHVDVADGIEAAVASLAEHRKYLEALSGDPVHEQARAQVVRATGGPDADPPRVHFTVYG